MKSRLLPFIPLLGLAVLAMPVGLPAQAQAPKPASYTVTDLGTLGGAYSFAFAINNSGAVAGGAATSSQTDFVSQTAFLWDGAQPINLGTLGGAACPGCSSEGAAVSANGAVAILSETANADPNRENFCGFGTHRQCLAGIWKNGALTALPTPRGGNNSQAYWINNQGDIIGFSENGTPDASCAIPFQVLRFEAVKWPLGGEPIPLSPVLGDTVSFALGINNNGQAVGVSGLCSNTTVPPNNVPGGPHAVLWDQAGSPTDLGSLPGRAGNNVAASINNLGEVVGTSLLSDGTVHSFLWTTTTGMQDLGTFPDGAPFTVAGCCHTINDRAQVVGFSIDATGNTRALLWQGNIPTDLNTLIPADLPLYLLIADSINDAGEIVGVAVNTNTFEVHGFLASPIAGIGPAARGATRPPTLPENVHELLQRRLHF